MRRDIFWYEVMQDFYHQQSNCICHDVGIEFVVEGCRVQPASVLRESLAPKPAKSTATQGLLFWLFDRGLKVSLDIAGGIEAVMELTLIILKQRPCSQGCLSKLAFVKPQSMVVCFLEKDGPNSDRVLFLFCTPKS